MHPIVQIFIGLALIALAVYVVGFILAAITNFLAWAVTSLAYVIDLIGTLPAALMRGDKTRAEHLAALGWFVFFAVVGGAVAFYLASKMLPPIGVRSGFDARGVTEKESVRTVVCIALFITFIVLLW